MTSARKQVLIEGLKIRIASYVKHKAPKESLVYLRKELKRVQSIKAVDVDDGIERMV